MKQDAHFIREKLQVGALIEALRPDLNWSLSLELDVRGREVASPHIQKPGLILSGLWEYLDPKRIQVIGRSELAFLGRQPDAGLAIGQQLCAADPPLIVLTRGMSPPAGLEAAAATSGVPLATSERTTAEVIEALTSFLRVRLAPQRDVHGVLVEVFGVGVLLLGESGVGKSECALELLSRGHRLVADDRVKLRGVEGRLLGQAAEMSRDHLEVRGLGIVNARQMFGIAAASRAELIEMAVRLIHVDSGDIRVRFGAEPEPWEMLGARVPLVEVPVAPGRSLAVLVETAVRQQLLREDGQDAGRELRSALSRRLTAPSEGSSPEGGGS